MCLVADMKADSGIDMARKEDYLSAKEFEQVASFSPTLRRFTLDYFPGNELSRI